MDIARNLVDAARNLAAQRSPTPERAYRLRTDEHVPDGIRRIARGQLLDARDELHGTPSRRLAEAVHETRKRIKRLRASVRLSRKRDRRGDLRAREHRPAHGGPADLRAARRAGAARDARRV